MKTSTGPGPILLFYDGYEIKAREGRVAALFHTLRSHARFAYGRLRGRHNKSGFYVAFRGLEACLRQAGYHVRVNDFRAARANPDWPIGLAGYPSVLDRVNLPNPVIFGPGDPGYPPEAGKLASEPRIRRMIQPSEWYVDFYRPTCGDKMLRMPVGLDLAEIPDAAGHSKSVDVLIYDKIRWNRDRLVPDIRDRLARHLDARGLTHEILVYEHHTKPAYFAALRRSRTMAFLCEHETQGLACEEALAMNLPVFAWDEGLLADPRQVPLAPEGLRVSSIPYWDDRCGVSFTLQEMEPAFDRFWAARAGFRPRNFVAEALSMAETAAIYAEAYFEQALLRISPGDSWQHLA